ncbi:hypothetical protein J6590_051903 [Homalodisca vitripennis]|nr:hypothetical protein J6590_051903 [Homalodisca vitripennis]
MPGRREERLDNIPEGLGRLIGTPGEARGGGDCLNINMFSPVVSALQPALAGESNFVSFPACRPFPSNSITKVSPEGEKAIAKK